MNPKQYFAKYYRKFRTEAVLKSLLMGLRVGFAVAFAVALITWFTPINGLWITVAALVAVTAVTTPICYHTRFQPTVKQNARRLDSLGLEERLITMVQYRDDPSYMAQRQRQDAQQALEAVEVEQVRIQIRQKTWITTAVFAVLSIAMIAVSALSAFGLLPSGNELVEELLPDEPEVWIAVTYFVEEGGYIEGQAEQLVLQGENADTVMAVADDGYSFVGWDDGSNNPTRTEFEVQQELTYTAIFAPIDGEGDGDGDGDGDTGDEGGDEPGDAQEGDQEGDGPPSDGESESENVGEGSGKYDEWNQIIDGEKYYREFLESYKERLLEQLEKKGDQLTDEERAIIEAYINLV